MSAASAVRFDVEQLRSQLVAITHDALRLDIRDFEEVSAKQLVAELSPRVASLLERALAVLAEVLRWYDRASDAAPGPDSDSFDFGLAVDELLAHERESPATKIADLAFIASGELRQRRARVAAHTATLDAWEIVCDCGSAVRRVVKSLGAIELAVCEVEHLERVLAFDSELEVSLQTRRLYKKVWRSTRAVGEVEPSNARHALRKAGTLVATIVGRDVYCRLRERDRFQLRALQRRVLEWLRDENPDARAGVRLWEDFASFAEMLRQVSNRQELVKHDVNALRLARQSLEAGNVTGASALLARLDGLDDELDAALTAGARDELLAATVRVLERLDPSSAPKLEAPI